MQEDFFFIYVYDFDQNECFDIYKHKTITITKGNFVQLVLLKSNFLIFSIVLPLMEKSDVKNFKSFNPETEFELGIYFNSHSDAKHFLGILLHTMILYVCKIWYY